MPATGDMVQVHTLVAYPASLLNRDDAGLAKRIPFGGVERTRISSQCLKKHWRDSQRVAELGELAVRSTRIYEDLVARTLVKDHGASEAEAAAVARFLMEETVNTKPAKSRDGKETLQSGQLLVLTRAETRFLAERGAEILAKLKEAGSAVGTHDDVRKAGVFDKKQWGPTLKTLQASIDTAMFGRMVTSDLFARVDAAVSVAHAFTTHAAAAESDYFTAVDTLKDEDEGEDAGAGLIGETELTSGVFYTYAVIDMNQLRANLGEQETDAETLARALVEAIATVSPGAKRGSTAPYSFAELVLLERGAGQPRTLANAFLKPVEAGGAGVMAASVAALADHRTKLEDRMYGPFQGLSVVSGIHDETDAVRADRLPFQAVLDRVFPGARP
ncbi:MAG: type I-E CRISPR-associated protein Cas7/Cse4/CasC [Longimicrobiaceae bacterium]